MQPGSLLLPSYFFLSQFSYAHLRLYVICTNARAHDVCFNPLVGLMPFSDFMALPPGPFGPDSIPFTFKLVGSTLHDCVGFGVEECGINDAGQEVAGIPFAEITESLCPACAQSDFYSTFNGTEHSILFSKEPIRLAPHLLARLASHEKTLASAASSSFRKTTGDIFTSDFNQIVSGLEVVEAGPFSATTFNLMTSLGWDRVYDSLLSGLLVKEVLSRGLAPAQADGELCLADFSGYSPLRTRPGLKNAWLYANPESFLRKDKFPVFSSSFEDTFTSRGVATFRCPRVPDERVLETLTVLFDPAGSGPYASFSASAEAAFLMER